MGVRHERIAVDGEPEARGRHARLRHPLPPEHGRGGKGNGRQHAGDAAVHAGLRRGREPADDPRHQRRRALHRRRHEERVGREEQRLRGHAHRRRRHAEGARRRAAESPEKPVYQLYGVSRRSDAPDRAGMGQAHARQAGARAGRRTRNRLRRADRVHRQKRRARQAGRDRHHHRQRATRRRGQHQHTGRPHGHQRTVQPRGDEPVQSAVRRQCRRAAPGKDARLRAQRMRAHQSNAAVVADGSLPGL